MFRSWSEGSTISLKCTAHTTGNCFKNLENSKVHSKIVFVLSSLYSEISLSVFYCKKKILWHRSICIMNFIETTVR